MRYLHYLPAARVGKQELSVSLRKNLITFRLHCCATIFTEAAVESGRHYPSFGASLAAFFVRPRTTVGITDNHHRPATKRKMVYLAYSTRTIIVAH